MVEPGCFWQEYIGKLSENLLNEGFAYMNSCSLVFQVRKQKKIGDLFINRIF